ncbi:OmpA family protein [Actinomyces sp. ZJ308]|uniref:OmpA family protein n=1 Tax=Actinomyces sp. ZJ308 TaxID=2708342 RepID=UPI00141F9420|nr:OmpA family protein [Actinomyces sp. ZJ308]
MRRRAFLSSSLFIGAGLFVLAGCKVPGRSSRKTGSASSSASAGRSPGTAVPAPSPPPQGWQQLDAHILGHHLGIQVSPLVRRDENTTVLALKLARAKDDLSVKDVTTSDSSGKGDNNIFEVNNYLSRSGSNQDSYIAGGGVRLLDLKTGRVWEATTGVEQTGKDNYANAMPLKPSETTSCYILFGPVDAQQVTVFVPQTGFATIDVVDSDAAEASSIDFKAVDKAFDDVISYSQDKLKPNDTFASPVPIERYTRALDGSTSTHTGSKDVTVTLASDVTFASDSADLAPGAQAQLQTVANQLGQYPDGGSLTIMGHTDDVQDDAYNQALSERRATAVQTRLSQLADLGKWQTSVSGKGESEPRVNDTTDEARAANRRVEITLTPTGGTATKDPAATPSSGSGSLPEAKGAVAKGAEGISLNHYSGKGTVTITLDQVTRTGGYLLGQLQVVSAHGTDDTSDLASYLHDEGELLSNTRGERRGMPSYWAADGLTLLAGGERIFPADYLTAGAEVHMSLTELRLMYTPKTGTTTVCVVWPEPGGDTITLDHDAPKYGSPDNAFRLTGVRGVSRTGGVFLPVSR